MISGIKYCIPGYYPACFSISTVSICHCRGYKTINLVNRIKKRKHPGELFRYTDAIFCDLDMLLMKLTIVRLDNFSGQDLIDLSKIWPEYSASSLSVDETHRIYAARFNERLLGAVRVTLSGTQGALDSLRVRDITRRRGVGQYLIEEVIRENPDVSSWWMADVGVEDRSVMTAFMQASGFTAQENGWEKR